jgi:polyketide biosynthesis acyl carrier protein
MPQAPHLDKDAILNIIISNIREIVPELASRTIGGADSMADLGVDSMERGDVLMSTLEAIGLEIPLVQLHGPRNLGELAQLIHDKLAQA